MSAARRNTYFISDLHLGASYLDDPRGREQRVCRFLKAVAPTARRIVLVGDILDYWYEYRTVVPRGYVRFFGTLAELADSGIEILWYVGNHDIWLFDYLQTEIGITVVDPKDGFELRDIDGTLFCIGHGDGIGHRTCSFRFMRALFRNKCCQKLYSAVHPRWTVPFAHRWSSHSRKASDDTDMLPARIRTDIEVFVRHLLTERPELRYIVVGHHHVALDEPVSDSCRMIVLGDWISRSTYGVFDGNHFALKDFSRDE